MAGKKLILVLVRIQLEKESLLELIQTKEY